MDFSSQKWQLPEVTFDIGQFERKKFMELSLYFFFKFSELWNSVKELDVWTKTKVKSQRRATVFNPERSLLKIPKIFLLNAVRLLHHTKDNFFNFPLRRVWLTSMVMVNSTEYSSLIFAQPTWTIVNINFIRLRLFIFLHHVQV